MEYIKQIHLKKENNSFIFIVFILLLSCKPYDNRDSGFGERFNKTRVQIGLKPLESGWISMPKTKDGRVWWYNPNVDSLTKLKPYYNAKVSLIRNDTLICETDQYESPEYYETEYGKSKVSLLYTYYFYNYEEFSSGWTYYLRAYPGLDNINGYISKFKADSVLSSWGLSYP